jgi:hypothetical protein
VRPLLLQQATDRRGLLYQQLEHVVHAEDPDHPLIIARDDQPARGCLRHAIDRVFDGNAMIDGLNR